MKKNKNIIIGVGGNISSKDGSHPIDIAIKAIDYLEKYSINVIKKSSWYESEPIPKSNQPNFYNCVVFAKTSLNELDTLKSLHKIEFIFGRKRNVTNEPRVIDLDLIDYSSKILENQYITIPHPRAHQRRFVMEPLAELKIDWVHPILRTDVNKILKKLKNQKINILNEKKL